MKSESLAITLLLSIVTCSYAAKPVDPKFNELDAELVRQVLNLELIRAVKSGNHEAMIKLLERGADPNATYEATFEDTPVVFIAIGKHDFESFMILKRAGADLEIRKRAGMIPVRLIDYLIRTENVDLIEKVMPELSVSKSRFVKALEISSEFEKAEVFNYLLTVAHEYMRPESDTESGSI